MQVIINENMHGCLLRGFARTSRKSQSSELSGRCAGPVDFVQSYGMQYESENPFFDVRLGFFPRKSRQSQ